MVERAHRDARKLDVPLFCLQAADHRHARKNKTCMFSKGLLVKGYKGPIQSVINCLRNCFSNNSIVYEILLTIVQMSEQLF